MSILARKLLLKMAQDPESEALLKKHLGPETSFEDPIFKEMIARGIIPIISVRQDIYHSALLGHGAYNNVFEVSYKGRLAVAKVTSTKKDYDVMLLLNALKQKVGEDGKYIATVLDHFISKDSRYVMVVEKLNPLNSHLLEALFHTYEMGKSKTSFSQFKNQYDYLEIIEKMNDYLKINDSFKELDNDIKILFLEKINYAFKKVFMESNSLKEFQDKFYNQRRSIANEMCRIIKSKPNPNKTESWEWGYKQDNLCYGIGYLCDIAASSMHDILPEGIAFPLSHSYSDEKTTQHFLNKPETKGFLEFLLKLKHVYNIKWADLHEYNIMVRPKTGDLVISDPGLFTVPEQIAS